MKKVILSILFLFLAHHGFSQTKLTASRQRSFYTYIYKLSDADAKKFYGEKLEDIGDQILTKPVDSFKTDERHFSSLAPGNYLKVYAVENELKYEFIQ
ncbi:MAG: hypothetical protein JWQ25_1521, partial [Daejeonella sp.]|nr:hypothetical protein [Daejeonella sp.]